MSELRSRPAGNAASVKLVIRDEYIPAYCFVQGPIVLDLDSCVHFIIGL